MFYLHPWGFDTEHEKIPLPLKRHFMHYCNTGSTEKKITLLLERLAFSTVEDVLALRSAGKGGKTRPATHGSHLDTHYLKSAISGYLLMLSVCAALCVAAALVGAYAVLIVIVFATIFYWPWGLVFNDRSRHASL